MGNACYQREFYDRQSKLNSLCDRLPPKCRQIVQMEDNDNTGFNRCIPIREHFEIIYPEIGSGGSGKVYKIICKKTRIKFAAKKIKKSLINSQLQIVREIQILKELHHKYIIKIHSIYINDPWVYIVTDLCSGGELFDRIKRKKYISESLAANYIIQILEGVAYCHGKKVIHGDLKPQNIIFDNQLQNSSLKIIDFGCSTIYKRSSKKCKVQGTIYYVSPELLNRNLVPKGDLWAIGVILYITLSGQIPFNGKTDKEISDQISKGQYSLESSIWQTISHDAKSLIKGLLCVNVEKRLCAQKALQHPWIIKYKQNSLKDTNLRSTIFNMQKFCHMNKFQNCIMKFLITNMLDEDQQRDILKKFQAVDKDRNGRISLQQFKQFIGKQGNQDVLSLFNTIDINNSGEIDYPQFVISAIQKKKHLTIPKLSQIFDSLDEDKDGALSKSEIEVALGGKMSQEEFREMMSQQHVNRKGEIKKARFINSIKKLGRC